MKRTQAIRAGIFTALMLVITGFAVYLTLALPKKIEVWADQGLELPVIQRLMVQGSNFCVAHAIWFFPLLILSSLAALGWLAMAVMSGE